MLQILFPFQKLLTSSFYFIIDSLDAFPAPPKSPSEHKILLDYWKLVKQFKYPFKMAPLTFTRVGRLRQPLRE